MNKETCTDHELQRNFEKDIIKSRLDIIFLIRIKNSGALSGYDLMQYIKDKYKISLSSGTIYTQLYCLERKFLIEGKLCSSGKRTYSLTLQGARTLEIILSSKNRFKKVITSFFEEEPSQL